MQLEKDEEEETAATKQQGIGRLKSVVSAYTQSTTSYHITKNGSKVNFEKNAVGF
jgi:hypothetical protein